MSETAHIAVIGAGAWGTALAAAAARNNHKVTLWAREPEVVEAVNNTHINSVFLDGVLLPENITATNDLGDVADADAILMVSPAQFCAAVAKDVIQAGVPATTPLVICSKGIEIASGKMLTDVLQDAGITNPLAVLSGPSFAIEVAKNIATHVNVAAEDIEVAAYMRTLLHNPTFRVTPIADIVAAQLGGSFKNVIAIASGMVIGAGFGENAKALVISKGVKEMRDLILSQGGERDSLYEPCCLGDLLLTTGSSTSRNMSLGMEIGGGKSVKQIMKERNTVAEGIKTAEAMVKHGLATPLCEQVHNIATGADDNIAQLMR